MLAAIGDQQEAKPAWEEEEGGMLPYIKTKPSGLE
jgi:hypothetical protein